MHERQLDRIGDLLDLVVEAADVVVGDVGNLFEHEFLDIGTGQPFEHDAGAGLDQDTVAGAEWAIEHAFPEFDHAVLVGATDDHRPAAVLEHFLDGGDFARGLGTPGHHDVERFVEHDFLAALERAEKFGLHRHAHLAAAGVNVDGVVVV